ncbi:hypothetical protein BC777_3820 [Yoonia maricola]|uniref:Tat pathway signal sequence domain protein n=1 Tax=Yoonia maricola TaxID=420999 RepID=A0A2M8W041_9RHOB|nr:hypothetical protein [Yoonia maricola]PJI84279.1 hypothetical protein BC777_3820 [Yoonia maricola]
MTRPLIASLFALSVAVPPSPALAQEQALSLQLDSLAQVETACRLTFVARNGFGSDLAALVVEAVAFDAEGGIAQISLLDLGALPSGSLRVRQFDLAGTACDGIGSVLINGVQRCEGADSCDSALSVSSRAGVELMK